MLCLHAYTCRQASSYRSSACRRLAYVETFGRWHTADLFFGLAYLSQRDNSDYVAADIAAKAIPVSSDLSLTQSYELLVSLLLSFSAATLPAMTHAVDMLAITFHQEAGCRHGCTITAPHILP